jgi:hypothetical protein
LSRERGENARGNGGGEISFWASSHNLNRNLNLFLFTMEIRIKITIKIKNWNAIADLNASAGKLFSSGLKIGH